MVFSISGYAFEEEYPGMSIVKRLRGIRDCGRFGESKPVEQAREPLDRKRAYADMLANTIALQKALERAGNRGGGCVEVPRGMYWIRTLSIPSKTELHIPAGAMLIAWPYIEDYLNKKTQKAAIDEARKGVDYDCPSLIVSQGTSGASLTGGGAINGNGFAFWDPSIREHIAKGGSVEDLHLRENWEEDSPFRRPKENRLSPLVEFNSCDDLLVRDICIQDSPGWTLHLYCCEGVAIENLKIQNYSYGPNTDGIDINGCRDVIVRGCRIKCGDDAVIIKATTDARSCERILVSDCVMSTHCAAFGIGAETVHTIRDITAANIVVERALRMVQIELWDAGLVENVMISNMVGANMTDIPLERPIYVDIQHHTRTDGALGSIRNLSIRGLNAITRGRCLFTAADGASIKNLLLSDIQLIVPELEDPKISVVSSVSSQMSNSNFRTRAERALFIFDNVDGAIVRDLRVIWPDENSSDPADACRGSFDRGDLSRDRRKQLALVPRGSVLPMDAVLLRRCRNMIIDAPLLYPYGGELERRIEE